MGVSNISIKNKLTLMFVVVIFAMTMIQTYITEQLLNETYRSIQQYSTTLTNANVSGIEKWVAGRINVVNAARMRLNTQTTQPVTSRKVTTQVGSKLLMLVFRWRTAKALTCRFLKATTLALADWYKKPMATGQTVVTEPYIDVAANDGNHREPFAHQRLLWCHRRRS